jgi:hypothetical protein
VDVDKAQHWDSRVHFFAAAAEAMRRILVEGARRKKRLKRGGDRERVDLDDADLVSTAAPDELLVIDEAIGTIGLMVGDFNGDGLPDVAVVNTDAGSARSSKLERRQVDTLAKGRVPPPCLWRFFQGGTAANVRTAAASLPPAGMGP